MSNPTPVLRAALIAALKADAGVAAAFDGDAVRVYDVAPVNAGEAYIVVARIDVTGDPADCMDGADVQVQLDIWSLPTVRGFAQADAIAAAAGEALATTDLTLAGYRVVTAYEASALSLPDGERAHVVVSLNYGIDAAD